MADVEAFDALRGGRQAQRLLQRAQTLILRRFLRELLTDRQRRVLHRHGHPHTPLAARIGYDLHLVSRLLAQHLREHRVLSAIGRDDGGWRRSIDVVLTQKCQHDFFQRGVLRVLRKKGPVADMPSASHHHHIDCGQALVDDSRDNVDVTCGGAFHELARLQLLQPGDLVAQPRRAFERKRRGCFLHLPLQECEHLVRFALEEKRRILDVLLILGLGDQTDARPRAALDLIEHARARSVGEHAVLARAKLKDFLQQRHALAHRARAGERPEIAMRLVELSPVKAQLREGLAREAHIRIALVVAEHNVVTGLVRLDQIVLEQQRFTFGTRYGRLDIGDVRNHHRCSRMMVGLLKVARHAFLEVARLADVERRPGRVDHAIDARPVRQRREQLARVEPGGASFGVRFCRHRFDAFRPRSSREHRDGE